MDCVKTIGKHREDLLTNMSVSDPAHFRRCHKQPVVDHLWSGRGVPMSFLRYDDNEVRHTIVFTNQMSCGTTTTTDFAKEAPAPK